LYSECLLNSFISSDRFSVVALKFPRHKIISMLVATIWLFSNLNVHYFIPLDCSWLWLPILCLIKVVKVEYCLVPDLKDKVYILYLCLLYMGFDNWLCSVFYHEGYWILLNEFLDLLRWSYYYFFFDLRMLNNPFILGMISMWLWWIIFLMC
jgi:hypothetical protein